MPGHFVIAALGGAAMNLLFHWKLLALPIPLMSLHAPLAVVGHAFLLVFVCRRTYNKFIALLHVGDHRTGEADAAIVTSVNLR
jgi:hypothetical protein